jgi:hypothetical protein
MQRGTSRRPKKGEDAWASKKEESLFVWLFRGTALRTVTADFQSGNDDVEPAIPLNLSLQAVEEIALKFSNLAAAETCHVNVVPLRPPLVVVLLALHVHQVKFVNQAVPLQQAKRAINRHSINLRIEAACAAEQLAGVKVLFGGFNHAEYRTALAGHAESTRHQFGLKTSWDLGLG